MRTSILVLSIISIPSRLFLLPNRNILSLWKIWEKLEKVPIRRCHWRGIIASVGARHNRDGNKDTSSIFFDSIEGKDVRELNTGMQSSSDPVWPPDGKSWVRNLWQIVG